MEIVRFLIYKIINKMTDTPIMDGARRRGAAGAPAPGKRRMGRRFRIGQRRFGRGGLDVFLSPVQRRLVGLRRRGKGGTHPRQYRVYGGRPARRRTRDFARIQNAVADGGMRPFRRGRGGVSRRCRHMGGERRPRREEKRITVKCCRARRLFCGRGFCPKKFRQKRKAEISANSCIGTKNVIR